MSSPTFELLLKFVQTDGGVPYRAGTAGYAEPTILLCLAGMANNEPPALMGKSIRWLIQLQSDSGALSHNSQTPGEGQWTTAQFALLMHHLGKTAERDRAIGFLMAFKSLSLDSPDSVDLDCKIVGWPWVKDNFGWVEPTSWALLALRLAGMESDTRFLDGIRLLKNRCIPGGGWNYGNKVVYNNQLLPFWDTTALAILALGDQEKEFNKPNIEMLQKGLISIEALYSLSLVCICLEKAGIDVTETRLRIEKILPETPPEDLNIGHAAMGLIALAPRRVLTP